MNTTIPTGQVDVPHACANGCVDDAGEPRISERGSVYCARDRRRFEHALRLAPALLEHVVSMRTHRGGSDGKVDVTREAPLPFNLTAVDDADAIYAYLARTSILWAATMNLPAPIPPGALWMAGDGTVIGLPANRTPAEARFHANVMTVWLHNHLRAALTLHEQPIATALRESPLVFRIDAAWPRQEPARWSAVRCPACRDKFIAVYPPTAFEDPIVYVCSAGCGRHFTEDQVEELARHTLLSSRMSPAHQRIALNLLKKATRS